MAHSCSSFRERCLADGGVLHLCERTECCQRDQAGDALFIPEGWWHQIDSDDLTVAVSHWWEGAATVATTAAPDAGPYHVRRLLRAEIEQRTAQLLGSIYPMALVQKSRSSRVVLPATASDRAEVSGGPVEARALSLIALAVGRALEKPTVASPTAQRRSDHMGDNSGRPGKRRSTATGAAADQHADDASNQLMAGLPCCTEAEAAASLLQNGVLADADVELGLSDNITRTFAALSPDALRRVLDAAAARVPRTVEALLLHALRPAAAELLTRKLEHADEVLLRAGKGDEQVHA